MGEQQSARLDGIFNALCDPTRRAILARLTAADARVTDIAADFPISLNSISKHIRMLERAGLLRRSVNGRDHLLSLNAGPLAEAQAWLARHGISARARHEPAAGDVGETLLSRAADLSADLLVMGGYGHARVREWVLGGATRQLLGHMTLPTLMAH